MGILQVNWLTDSFHADDNLTDPDVQRLVPAGFPMVRFGPFIVATHAEERAPLCWEGFDSAERLLLSIHYPGWAMDEQAIVAAFETCAADYTHTESECDLMEEARAIAKVLQSVAIPFFLRLAFLSYLDGNYAAALQVRGKVPVCPETFAALQFALSHMENTRAMPVSLAVQSAFQDSMFVRPLTR